MSDVEKTCCAHLDIVYDPSENDDGTVSEYWQCKRCGKEFRMASEVDRLKAENDSLEIEIDRLKGDRDSWRARVDPTLNVQGASHE